MLSERIHGAVSDVENAYYHLVLVVGPHGSGKTPALRSAAAENGWPLMCLGFELAAALADVPVARRPSVAPEAVERLITAKQSRTVAIDDIEILFEPSLRLKPLELLKQLSRSTVLIATWPGAYAESRLMYAEPGWLEHLNVESTDVSVVSIESIPSQ